VHEAAHSALQDSVGGVVALWRLPKWKVEGFAEAVARPGGDLAAEVRRLDDTRRPAFDVGDYEVPRVYFEAGLLWRWLAEARGMTARQILALGTPRDVLLEQMRDWAATHPLTRMGRTRSGG
jgi:hypothetical protein